MLTFQGSLESFDNVVVISAGGSKIYQNKNNTIIKQFEFVKTMDSLL